MTIAIGVDVGGSGIKCAAVDLDTGQLASTRQRVPTPQPSTPEAMIPIVSRLVKNASAAVKKPNAPVGVGMPCVVLDGTTITAANIDRGWTMFPATAEMSKAVGRSVHVGNDADLAGLAEIRYGLGATDPTVLKGVVIFLTLGTGVGSGLFNDGVLVPNTELGHMEIRGKDAERRSAAAARVRRGESWKFWASELDEHLKAIDKILWPTAFIIGGGISKNADKFVPRLTCRPKVLVASLRNEAGIVGAALLGASREAQIELDPAK